MNIKSQREKSFGLNFSPTNRGAENLYYNMEKVIVLMSTYNGEKYLEEQLESLLAQEGVDVDIFVRDDGSSDGTQAILDKWETKGLLKWYAGQNLGWANSFMNLVQQAPTNHYYAFCDQDDVWLPSKLQEAIKLIRQHENSPCLYFSNLLKWKDGEIKGNVKSEDLYFDEYTALLQCPAYGCTMVFNDKLMGLLQSKVPRFVYAHDFWVFQIACLLGKVVYDPKAYLLYRQHDNNQIGAKKGWKKLWKRRIKSLKTILNDHKREYIAQQIYSLFQNDLTQHNKNVVSVVANYRKDRRLFFKFLFSKHYVMNRFNNTIWLKLRIMIGKV